MKGCGEAGTVGALAAVTNAALDAVWDAGVRHVDMPLTPIRLWTWLNAGKIAAE
jgi:carbon-monoxide dehydrogenase large subunit